MIKGDDQVLTTNKFFHYVATAMSVVIIGLMGWIGLNVADIPVIKNQMAALTNAVSEQGWIAHKLDDHEERIRLLEKEERKQ